MAGGKLEKIFDIDMRLLRGGIKKDKEEEFLALLNDAVKHITNTWKIIFLQIRQNTYRTWYE